MKTTDITVVLQGACKAYVQRDSPSLALVVKSIRKVLPGARLILSTWEGSEIPENLVFDEVVFSQDPGALAPLKLTDDKSNNINRQLVTTQAGMRRVRTPYAVKMRTDCLLEHAGFIDFYEAMLRRDQHARRIVTTAFFTLDTAVFERIAYHLSDWFQFARTEVLQAYWETPPMTPAAGRFYQDQPHAPGSNVFERRFRAEFAVEQYICMAYARSLGYQVPAYLNDVSAPVLADARRFLAQETLVLDPWQCGLAFWKYRWVNDSVLQRINNVMHLDWLALAGQASLDDVPADELRGAIARRRRLKALSQRLFQLSSPLHGVLFASSGQGRWARRLTMKGFRLLRALVRA